MGGIRLDELDRSKPKEDPVKTEKMALTGKTGPVRLGDIESAETVEVPTEIPTISEDNPIGLTPQQKAFFKGKSKIGFFEGLKRSDGLNDLRRLIQHGDLNPFAPITPPKDDNLSFLNALDVKTAVDRFKANNYKDIEGGRTAKEHRQEDIKLINGFLSKFEEERIRGSTTLGSIGTGVGELPLFMIEFLATGPLATGAKQTLFKTVQKGVKEGVTKRVTKGITGLAVEAGVRTGLLPHRTAKSFANRQIFANMELTDKGLQLSKESSETPTTSFVKALGDTYIEMFSEGAGAGIGATTKGVTRFGQKFIPKKFVPVKLAKGFEKVFKVLNPEGKVSELWSKAGFNGFINELGEERLGDILRAVTGVEDFGTAADADMLDKIIASFPNGEEMLVEMGVLAFPTAGNFTTQQISSMITKRKKELGIKEESAELKDLTDEQAKTITKDLVAEEPTVEKPTAEKPEARKEVVEPVEAKPKETAPKPVEKKPETKEKKKPKKPPVDKQQKLIVEGRVDELNRESNLVEDELKLEETKRRQLVDQGKATTVVDKKIDSLRNAFDNIEQEIAELRAKPTTIKVAEGAKIRTTPSRVLSTIRAKALEGVKFTKADIKTAQTQAIDALNRSRLSSEDRAKFINTIKGIQSTKDFANKLPSIQKRIAKLEDKSAKKRLRASILNKLSGVTGKLVGKKLKGRFRGEAIKFQDKLNLIKEATRLSREEATTQIQKNIKKLEDPSISLEEATKLRLQNGILDKAADLDNMTSVELEGLNAHVASLIKSGKTETEAFLQKEKAQREIERAAALQNISPVDRLAPRKDTVRKKFKKFTQTIGQGMSAFENIIGFISSANSTQPVLDENLKPMLNKDGTPKTEKVQQTSDILTTKETNLQKIADVFEAEQAVKEQSMELAQEFHKEGMRVYRLNEKDWNKKIEQDAQILVDEVIPDRSGKDVRVQLTKAEIRKIAMEMKDPFIEENVSVVEGGYVIDGVEIDGISDAMIEKIWQNPEVMTNKDWEFVDSQLKLYEAFYNKVNPVYRRLTGIDLPKIQFYSPVKRQLTQQAETETFFDEQDYRVSSDPSLLKVRVKNFNKLRSQSDITAMLQHIAEMTHYINFAEKNRQLDSLFGNSKIRNAIEKNYGQGTLKIIDGFRDDFKTRGSRKSEFLDGMLRTLRLNYTTSALGFNVSAVPKQITSFLAFMERVPADQFMLGVADFLKNPVKNWKLMRNTGFGLTRKDSVDRDMQQAAKLLANSKFKKLRNFNDLLMVFTKMGDFGGIVLGGWAMRRHLIKNGGQSVEQADKGWARVAASTQQSGDISQQSAAQRAGEFWKIFTMFTTSQNALFRRELQALKQVAADPKMFLKGEGRITRKAFAKKMFIYHFAIPTIFQFVANGFRWDDEDQLRAAALGSFNGLFIFGDILDNMTRVLLNGLYDTELDVFDQQAGDSPVFGIMKDIIKEVRQLLDGGAVESEEILEGLTDLTKDVGGPLTGIPAKRIWNSYEGVEDILEGDIRKGVFRLLGWTPYALQEEEKEKPRVKFDF